MRLFASCLGSSRLWERGEPSMILSLKNVTAGYLGRSVLGPIDLEIQQGAVGLLGPNGAGKSTLLKVLLGLMQPNSGEGTIAGFPLGSGVNLRRVVGYMPEADALIPGMKGIDYVSLAGELAGLPRRDASRRAHEILNVLELDEARYRLLDEYSTGMKQRIKLGQALIHDPPLLFLDEPTSGLDPAGRDAMLGLLKRLTRDHHKSFLLCTHLLGDVERTCSQVVLISGGKILFRGPTSGMKQGIPHEFEVELHAEIAGAAFPEGWARQGGATQFLVKLKQDQDVRTIWKVAQDIGTFPVRVVPRQEDLRDRFTAILSQEAEQQSLMESASKS